MQKITNGMSGLATRNVLNGLIFPIQNTQPGDYQILSVDVAKLIVMNAAVANQVKIPLQATEPIENEFACQAMSIGAGLTSIIGEVGTTVYYTAGVATIPQYCIATIVKIATNTWIVNNGFASVAAPRQDFSSSVAPIGFVTISTQKMYYRTDGVECSGFVEIAGVSNATNFSFSLPLNAGSVYSAAGLMWSAWGTDNNAPVMCRAYCSGGSNSVVVDKFLTATTTGPFTNVLAKGIKLTFRYFL